jgi:LmeA-like phospholipid-binding
MEFFTILLSGLLSLLSPANFVLDQVAENAIRDQFDEAEEVHVRIDNAPSYQVLQGRVERVRIAGRGLFPRPDVRIAALEVETDPIAINPDDLRRGNPTLDQPLQAGVRLVLNREDLNRALASPAIARRLRNLSFDLLGSAQPQQAQRYDLVNPEIEFLDQNRLRVRATFQEQGSDRQLVVVAESGLAIGTGQQLQFVDPSVSINDSRFPAQLVRQFTDGLSRQLDLQQLEASGLTVRVLQLKIDPEQLAIAAFVRVEPVQGTSQSLASGN